MEGLRLGGGRVGTVRACDVVAVLQRDGHPTALGEAIAPYGRIFKTLHILSYIDVDETYRRDIKAIRNLRENRHSLARKICHGRRASSTTATNAALENQLGALGLVLNCATLLDHGLPGRGGPPAPGPGLPGA